MNKVLCLVLFGWTLIACDNGKQQLITLEGLAFGTSYKIEYYEVHNNPNIPKGIDSIIYTINKSLSTYLPKSDITGINNGNKDIVTDSVFRDVFNLSKEIHRKSDGYFDPTVGVLRNAYGFGDTKPIRSISKFKLDSMMNYVGFDKVILLENGKVFKEKKNIYLDFNSIGKGYAIDKITEYIQNNGIENLRVEIGGEIRAAGSNLLYSINWTVGIESIDSKVENRKSRARIELKNKSIAGSGNFRKYRIDSNTQKKYVHTINPLNGSAEQGNVLSSYVLANTCAEADGYATTFMAMGIEKSRKLLSELDGIDAYLVYSDSLGETKTYITEGFKGVILD